MTADNRWAVYKDKSTKADSPKPTTKPSTIGKAGREGLGAGQGSGKGDKEALGGVYYFCHDAK